MVINILEVKIIFGLFEVLIENHMEALISKSNM